MPEETVVNHRASRSRSRARLKRNQTLCRLYQALSLHLLLLLDLLLLSDLRVQRDLGSLAVESDFGLFKIPAGICKESD